MWQAPPGGRGKLEAQKRRAARLRRGLHLKRVLCEIKLLGKTTQDDKIVHARFILSDISPEGLGLFAHSTLPVGQKVAVTLAEPRSFFVRGVVSRCQEAGLSNHVITPTQYTYRAGIQFEFENQAERDAVAKFCKELLAEFVLEEKKAA